MPKKSIGINVYDASVERMKELYAQGHRIVISFSGGKDSGVCLEVCLEAARQTNRLPVEVIMRDEEIMLPGTFEYCERVAQREEVEFHWIYACQPVVNVFNRENPYFWVFDDQMEPDKWLRKPPDRAYRIKEQNIEQMVTAEKFPPPDGKNLYVVVGIRTQESINRLLGVMTSLSHLTKENKFGVRKVRPIYDWTDGDVWLAHTKYDWDYNSAYDVMQRFGYSRNQVRIAPPTLATITVKRDLKLARKAFPKFFDALCKRLHGVRSATMYGLSSVRPDRQLGEQWKDTYERECIETAPDWIAERASICKEKVMLYHSRHSTLPFPDVAVCPKCKTTGSWKALSYAMYMGDPFSAKTVHLIGYVEPETFREGAGQWGGKPTF